MKKTRVAILFLLLTLFAACLPAAAELPAQITRNCRGRARIHNFIEYVELGNTHCGRYQCTHCGRESVFLTPREGHSGGTEIPTCTTGKTCALCGAKYGILGHDWGAWTPNGNGTHTRSCTRCPEGKTASCTGGTATCRAKAVCEVCGGEYGEKDPNNHDLVHHEAKAPTCKEIGWDAYDTCSRCDYTTYVELPAQHDLVHHEAKAPTCTEIGWNAYDTCSRCNYTTYVEIPASGHALTHHEAKAATCTEIGWDAYDTCSNCDYTTYVEIPASGHALTHHEAKAATCTEIGWNAYDTCGNCGYTTYAEIPASGHVLTNYGENWGLVFCPVCGKVENGERLELLETASAAAVDGKLPEGELVARMNQRYLSLAFVHEGKLTAPAGRVKITLPAEIVQGKRLLLIAPDGTETELPFEIVGETISFTLDFTEVENPAVLVLKPL